MGDMVRIRNSADSGDAGHGRVSEILTRSEAHPYGIKVRLDGGYVGRVTELMG